MRRGGPPALVLAGLAAFCPGPASAAADPAVMALRTRDAYVSPAALGREAEGAEDRLAGAAAALARQGRPVKMAIVAGPAGAPSMRGYAARLRRSLGPERTVVVTAPMRPVVAVGPRPPAEVTRRLRAAGAGRLRDPVARVIAAARAVAPTARATGSNVREVGALLGLAVLGGAWAVAIGLRRERRRSQDRCAERRAALDVHLDALDAQAARLGGREDLPPDARRDLARAREVHAAAAQALLAARDERSLAAVATSAHQCRVALTGARRLAGDERPGDPFAGLCASDPAHGPVGADHGTGDGAPALCDVCRESAALGHPPEVRRIPVGGLARPFRDAVLDDPPERAPGSGAASV